MPVPDTPEYFIPIYKTCPMCDGTGTTEVPGLRDVTETDLIDCHNCSHKGIVQVLIDLEEYADLTDMNEEALHNLKGYLRDET